jgi:neutral ceramidase
MKTTPLLIWLGCALSTLMTPGFAADAAWQASFASAKITPEYPVLMAGYANRIRPFERVAQDIHAKALLLEDATGQRVVLITTDLAGMARWFIEPLAKDIAEKTGLTREQLMFTWSHTHSGPMLSYDPTPPPGVSPTDAQNRVTNTKWLHARLVELVVNVTNAKREPVTLLHGRGVARFAMNRREFTAKGVILGVAPQGPVDRSVPVLRVDGADGRPRAIVFGAAVHNTTLGQRNMELCGDYAGFAQHYLQEKYRGAQAMFMMGCGGDANPYPRDTMDLAKAHGAELGAEVARVVESKLRPISGPLKIAYGQAALPLQAVTREQLKPLAADSPSWQIGNARQMLAMLERGEKLPTHWSAPVAVWQFGADLTLVALPREVVVDYVYRVEKAIGPLNLWVAAYANEGFGYLPSARLIAEGGYEARGLSSGDGWFAPAAEDALVAKVAELAAKAGRPAVAEAGARATQ